MQTAVADRPSSPEHFLKSDWDRILSLSGADRVNALWRARNPLSGSPLEAIWAFCVRTGKLRFFDVPRAREVAGNDIDSCRKLMGKYATWLPTVAHLRNHKPKITDICELVGAKHMADEAHLRTASEHFATYWRQFTDMTVLAVYDKRIFRQQPAAENAHVDSAVVQFYDFYHFRRNFWCSIPLDFVADSYDNLSAAYLHLFCDPRLFHPTKARPTDMFLWPWQRCIQPGPSGNVAYRPIATTSLVLDLRNSTTAMNLFLSAENYADFIADVTQAARGVVIEHGGFFDKETGDGIVAHFCDILPNGHAQLGQSAAFRAYCASRDLGRVISAICQRYQEFLSLGIWGLAPSIGIHSGEAVWMVVDQQVRAIGPSVVTAARLCSTAVAAEAIMSNGTFVDLGKILNSSELSAMSRKGVAIKEFGESAQLFAHSYPI